MCAGGTGRDEPVVVAPSAGVVARGRATRRRCVGSRGERVGERPNDKKTELKPPISAETSEVEREWKRW